MGLYEMGALDEASKLYPLIPKHEQVTRPTTPMDYVATGAIVGGLSLVAWLIIRKKK